MQHTTNKRNKELTRKAKSVRKIGTAQSIPRTKQRKYKTEIITTNEEGEKSKAVMKKRKRKATDRPITADFHKDMGADEDRFGLGALCSLRGCGQLSVLDRAATSLQALRTRLPK